MFRLIVAQLAIVFVLRVCCLKNNRSDQRSRRITSTNSDDAIRHEILSHILNRALGNNTTYQSRKDANKTPDFKCGGNISLTISADIKSPFYPSKYPADADCVWRLNAQNGQTLRIRVIKLSLERDKGCQFDYLEMPGGKKLCGEMTDKELTVNSSRADIKFHSDPNNEGQGFHLRVFAESRDCVSNVTVTNRATVSSPKYPEHYPDSSDCWTLITTDSGLTLTLTFEVLQLEIDHKCAYDYIEVFDSKTANNSLGRYCQKPDEVTISLHSTNNSILLHFHSDQLLNSIGFKAEVTASTISADYFDCDWSVNWNNQTVTSPKYPANYPPNLNCDLVISSPKPNEKVVLLFDWLQLEIDAECTSDRLEIWETGEKPSRVLCGRQLKPFKYVSTGKMVTLKFISDGFAEFAGFRAKFTFAAEQEKPSFTTSESPTPTPAPTLNDSVVLGSSHVLTCHPMSRGYTISWYKDDQIIRDGVSPDGTTLLIREFTYRSTGRYICRSGKEYQEIWLTIRESDCPTVLFRRRPKDQFVREGDLILLECSASDPKLDVRWEKEGQRVRNDSRVHHLLNGYLLFDRAVDADSGIYFCIIRSSSECELRSAALIDVYTNSDISGVCGKSHAQPSSMDNGKIVGGTDATRNAFPWHVMFWDQRRKSFCGGALLNEIWVVTASHCFESGTESAMEVRLGKYDQTVVEPTEMVTKIAEIIRHPGFSRQTFDNDVALVRLQQHISFRPEITPICVATSDDRKELDEYFFGQSTDELRIGHVTGWGQLKENGPQPRFLQELRVPIVDDRRCRNSTAFKVTNNMFCAGYGKEVIGDACKGDSGGPFVVHHKSRWFLLGLVSWGEGCGRNGKFGFYTRINNYLGWIHAIIKL